MSYVFPNAADEARVRLEALAATFDHGTIRALDATGIAAGWRCLEVGAGGGSIARWLADRVGIGGHVLATDLDPRHIVIGDRRQLVAQRHDLLNDSLAVGAFDLVHARLVLSHLSDPGEALARLCSALREGGTLVVEDFEFQYGSDAENDSETLRAMRALVRENVDAALGATLARRCRALGLIDVHAEARVVMYRYDTPGVEVLRQSFHQLRDRLLIGGLSAQAYARDLAALDDERFETRSPLLWTVTARRPCSAP